MGTMHVYNYVVLYALCECALCKLSSLTESKVMYWDPFLNSMLLLTSSVYVQSFIILRLLNLELSWRKTDIQDDRI